MPTIWNYPQTTRMQWTKTFIINFISKIINKNCVHYHLYHIQNCQWKTMYVCTRISISLRHKEEEEEKKTDNIERKLPHTDLILLLIIAIIMAENSSLSIFGSI